MASTWLLFASLVCLTSTGLDGLRMVHVTVPPVMMSGETAHLVCEYELEGDRLYSVSWYKDHVEIYRFVPSAPQPKHSYTVEGVHVEPHISDDRRVVLRNVNLKTSGMYRCEASAEAPSFQSVHGEGPMEVIALPEGDPEITGAEQKEYQIGDTLSVNCTSERSYPPAKLRWYINDRQVDSTHVAQLEAHHGLVRSQARLVVQVGPEHFQQGHMTLRCVATIQPPTSPPHPPPPAPATSPHHHQPLPRVATEIDNREARLQVRSNAPRSCAGVFVPLLCALLAVSS